MSKVAGQCFCGGCLLSAVLVCLLYFNAVFKSCNPSWPLPFDLALSHTHWTFPSGCTRRVFVLGHDGRHQVPSARSSCPGVDSTPLAQPSRLRDEGFEAASRGGARASFCAQNCAMNLLKRV